MYYFEIKDKNQQGTITPTSYDTQYFFYNNTKLQFPPTFEFNASYPELPESEYFCLHLYWQPIGDDKRYD